MNRKASRLHRLPRAQERGQVLVLFTLFIVVLIGAAALAVDYGSWLSSRRSYQATADAAALAGSHYLIAPDSDRCPSPTTCARTDSWKYLNSALGLGLDVAAITAKAATNTPPAGETVGDFKLWVDSPPSAAGSAYAGRLGSSNRVLFARVEAKQRTYFSGMLMGAPTVSAWATAGTFPSRWAVITLRRGKGNNEIDAGPSDVQDIKLAGNNSTLRVVRGDLGGNWGMKLTASSFLTMDSSSGTYQPAPYLIDWTSCGNSCWSNSQIVDGAGNSLSTTFPPSGALELPGFIQDPNYAPPPGLEANAPNAALPPSIPPGDGDSSGNVTINHNSTPTTDSNGDPVTCDPATASRLGPGWYNSITVQSGGCVILDPLHHYSNPNDPSSGTTSPVPSTQLPGVFYITGSVNITQSLVVGDGVTIIVRPNGSTNQLSLGAHQIIDLNRGCVTQSNGTASTTANVCTGGQTLGAWTTKGASPYIWNGSAWAYQSSQEGNIQTYGKGVALYVLKPSQYQSAPAVDANTTVVQVNSGAALAWNGITYAPHDNVMIAGQPNHAGVGQLVSWTFTFNGGTNVTQYFSGPEIGYPILLEPCASGNEGAC